jgi:hypothetical protein
MLSRSFDLGLARQPRSRETGRPRKAIVKLTLMSAVALALVALPIQREASANVFGQCAHERNLERKIAACTEASKSTSYPWVLHWVYRALARAHRERGETREAIASFARSLAAEEHEWVRREMDELLPLGSM